jgi:transposase
MQSTDLLERWHLNLAHVRERMYEADRPRERERWHALWLVGQGWSQERAAQALDRDPHTIGVWLDAFRQRGPEGLRFDGSGGSPPSGTRRNRPH